MEPMHRSRMPATTFEKQMKIAPCFAAVGSVLLGTTGYLGAWAFTAISAPVGGVFMAAFAASSILTLPIFNKCISSKNHPNIAGAIKFTASLISTALIAKLVTAAVTGTSLTAGNMATVWAASIGMALVPAGFICCAAAVFFAASYCLCPDELKKAFADRKKQKGLSAPEGLSVSA